MKYKITIIFIIILSVFGMGKTIEVYQNKLDEIRKANEFPGANLTIILPDNKVIKISSGVSNRNTNRIIMHSDRMFSGSIGKTYASAVLLQLIEEQKLNLDDPLSKFFEKESWFKRVPNHKDLTVKTLMNHTSGITEHVEINNFNKSIIKNPDKIWKPEELINYILDIKPLFPAGKGWSYADTNYILIGMIIEKITGNKYYKELDKRMLIPFKLNDTSPSVGRKFQGLIAGYTGNDPFRFPNEVLKNGQYVVNPQFEWTGGGLITNSYELALWAKLLYSKKVLKPETYKNLFQAYSTENGKKSDHGYGLGVEIWNTKHGLVYGHGGIFPGYQSIMKYYSKYDITIALQVNEDRTSNVKLKSVSNFVDPFIPIILKNLKNTTIDCP